MRGAEQVTFGGSGLDRAAHLRSEPATLANLMKSPGARFAVLWRGKVLAEGDGWQRLVWLPPGHPAFAEAAEPPLFLGLEDGEGRWVHDISRWQAPESPTPGFLDQTEQRHPTLGPDQAFVELRRVMGRLSSRDAELSATAKGILEWHRSHRFCARCGAPSTVVMAGWQRACSSCDAQHFPRTDPVVIMLITRGDRVLVGRSPGWPEGMYSLLAGFMEPGETIEAAVRREVFEEAGIRVGEVGYLASQPWPFPASLMIGAWGHATSEEIRLDPNEIEDALWLSREEMLDVLTGTHHCINGARKGAIARFLIDRWMMDSLE